MVSYMKQYMIHNNLLKDYNKTNNFPLYHSFPSLFILLHAKLNLIPPLKH